MNNTKAYLIYCIDNQNIANDISNDLGRVGVDFIHDTFDPITHDSIRQQYLNSTAPIFLLVSDNFLKTENCMRNILELVEDTRLRGRIKTVILEGRQRIEGTNQYETVPTKFERLGDVVNYINYWSIQYQAIRTEMRHATEERKAELEPKLDLIQEISTNILGDFMRYLRGTNYVAYNRLQSDNFRQLFEEFGGQGTAMMNEYRYLPTYVPIIETKEFEVEKVSETIEETVEDVVEKSEGIVEDKVEEVVETTTEVVDDIQEDVVEDVLETSENVIEDVAENIEENIVDNVEEIAEDVFEDSLDLTNIPGLNLLPDTEETKEETFENDAANDLSNITNDMLDDLADDLVSDDEENFLEDDIINEVFGDINEMESSKDETSSDALSDLIDELADDILEENGVLINEEGDEESDDVEGEHSVDKLDEEEEEVKGEPVEDIETPAEDVEEVEGESSEDDEVKAIDESPENLTDINDLLDDIADDLVNELEEDDVDGENKEDVVNEELGNSNIDESVEESNDAMDDLLLDLTDDIVEDETEEELEELIDELTIDSELDDGDGITQSSTDIAEELAASGDVKGATGLYRQLVETDPKNVDLRYAFAMMLIENEGDQSLAKENLLVASKLDEDDEDILFALGVISESEGNFEDAKGYYEKVILLDLEHEQAYYRLGSLLANAFENQQFVASSYLQRAISLDDEYAEAYFEYAKLLNTYFGKSKKAAKYFKKAIKNNRHFAEAHFELAKVYDVMGKTNKALRHYEDAVEINDRFSTTENDARFGVQAESLDLDAALASGEMQAKDSEPKGTVLITGATSGIGGATAELFARNGYNLIITGRREERLMALKSILEAEFSIQILTLTFDVRNQEAVESAIASLEGDWKNIDILVNNAGLAKGFAPINEGQLTHWETMIDTNLKGLLYMTRAVSPLMVENGKGFIINIGSIAGKETYTNGNVYCATKAAVDVLTKGMRLDLHQHNIRVTGIHPGHVETEFAIVRFDGDEERAKIYDDFQPLKAADVADTIYYVATRPAHVNIEDIVMWSTQQASATIIDRSGREKFAKK